MKGNFHVRFLGEGMRSNTLPLPDNLTSQFWANCYLNPFDHFVKQGVRCRAYLRFVDDFLLYSDSKTELWAWKAAIEQNLAQLRLSIHAGSAPRSVTEGIPFLGFVITPQRRRLKRRKGVYFRQHLRRQVAAYVANEITLAQLTASVQGWVNHVGCGNTVGLRKAILSRQTIPKRAEDRR